MLWTVLLGAKEQPQLGMLGVRECDGAIRSAALGWRPCLNESDSAPSRVMCCQPAVDCSTFTRHARGLLRRGRARTAPAVSPTAASAPPTTAPYVLEQSHCLGRNTCRRRASRGRSRHSCRSVSCFRHLSGALPFDAGVLAGASFSG